MPIYKGKPIFYGVNSFIHQYQGGLPEQPGEPLTETEEQLLPDSAGALPAGTARALRVESLLVESTYQDGRLVEERIHPADLGQDRSRPFSRLGIPLTPTPEMTRRVLEKVQRLSKPFGTSITIEDGVGIIRIPAGQTTTR